MTDTRRLWLVALSYCASITAGCGHAVSPPGGPPAPIDAAAHDGSATTNHGALPQVTTAGGRELAHVRLITMSFPGYPYREQVEAFGRWIVASDWYTTVGQDYGVGAGTYVEHVDLTDAPPAMIDDAEIQQYLVDKIGDGTLPAPTSGTDDVLYMVFYPATTAITLQGSRSCLAFGGYHDAVGRTNLHLPYAVLPLCPNGYLDLTDLGGVEVAASHELIEAATDADPFTRPAYRGTNLSGPWSLAGGEVGDLCFDDTLTEGDFSVQRVWSNTAAAAGGSPCIPVDTTRPYFNVSVSPNEIQEIAAGDSMDLTITGWSTDVVPDWNLAVVPQSGAFIPSATLGAQTINSGRSATLTVGVPAGTPSGSYAWLALHSTTGTGASHADHVWFVSVYVP